ncbi:MAG: adenosylmethionine-8-amino-7-oxononanoate aminotransferase [Caulobacteraceae bacterium]|nr:adenosylmethionine-8-amino-7-oxononanoate aminotransferase [Caulobacteraceae bacterium]
MNPDWYVEGAPHLWRPYSQMKTDAPPMPVERAEGVRLHLSDGRVLIDGMANWWTACHGHQPREIIAAIERQARKAPHLMLGGLAHEPAYSLAARLARILPGDLNHVFFAESGSVAVEIAMKMALQFWINRGIQGRTRFLSFLGGYHGDTLATMSVCDPDEGMHRLFAGVMPSQVIAALPVDAVSEARLDALLAERGSEIAAILVEPRVQGAGGMIFHDDAVLRRLRRLADRHDVLLIFDEIFTGFGRTGDLFACLGAEVVPDIITLSKALTGGVLPLSAAVATGRVFDAFWSDDPAKALMHGPTFMGNPLACAAALASIELFETRDWRRDVARITEGLETGLAPCRSLPGVVEVRVMGAIGVVEMSRPVQVQALSAAFARHGAWVRPMGRVIYLTPPLVIGDADLVCLTQAINEVLADPVDAG